MSDRMRKPIKWIWGGWLLLFLWSATVCTADEAAYQLDSVTVTAEKREENVQDIPSTISVLTETEIEDAGIETISDVIDMIPNMTINEGMGSYDEVTVRGLAASMFTGKNPVVLYVDGVPFDKSMHFDMELLNIQRVEVLRGPQGTLYGKNAIGGVINVVTKRPDNTLTSKVGLQFAERETYGLKGYVNGPLVKDKLFLGISGNYFETRGYMQNDHPDQDYLDNREKSSVHATLRWLPLERLEVDLQAGVDRKRNGADVSIAPGAMQYHAYKEPDSEDDSDLFSSSLSLRYQTEYMAIHSITTYKARENDGSQDALYLNNGRSRSTDVSDISGGTQELRVQSPDAGNGWKWLVGFYYSDEEQDYEDYSVTYDTTDYYGYDIKYNWPGEQSEETMAVFGQATLPLIDRLALTGGLRYERINKELDYQREVTRTDTGAQLSVDPFSGVSLPVVWEGEEDWDVILPKGVLSWDAQDNAMLYFSVAKGYLAGGLNAWGDDEETAKFDAQTSWNYELGAKTNWLGNRLSMNAALFYIDIDDIHVYSEPSPGVWIASNAAKAHSQGVELEVRARPLHGLDIGAAFGWVDAQFDEYGDYTDNTLQYIPAYTLNVNIQYRFASGWFARAEMEGFGKTYYDEANTLDRSPFELFHAKVGYETAHWDLYLYGNNLLDKEYFTSKSFSRNSVGEPRTIGVMASLRF
ncbi:TonB-dependent receptor [Desulfosarcina variabilis str. Montpellier]|uniref:TonB-dependent receptor n=1 Tax=Desulfosarcina variabilis TaxID=2300 RepID=UPI003AFB3FA6